MKPGILILSAVMVALTTLSITGCKKVSFESAVPPVACIKLDSTTFKVGQSISFVTCSSWLDHNTWDFGDGTIESATYGTTHAYQQPRTYIVMLTSTNEHGTDSKTISVKLLPVTSADYVGTWLTVQRCDTGQFNLDDSAKYYITITANSSSEVVLKNINKDSTATLNGVLQGDLLVFPNQQFQGHAVNGESNNPFGWFGFFIANGTDTCRYLLFR
jgi:PKD repeat protein